MYSGVGSSDLESNALLHTIIISESGLVKDYHRRQSSRVIEGRTIKRIKTRLNTLLDAHGDDLENDEEAKYKVNRLRRQLRYRLRLEEFRRVLYSRKGITSKWTTSLSGGDSHLHCAARWGHVEMCRDLLNEKWHINARNEIGQTPLVLASREGHVRVCKLLVKGKAGWRGGRAKLLMKDHFGHGCLGYALKGSTREGLRKSRGCTLIAELLQEEWARRRIVRRNKKKRLENLKQGLDSDDDLEEKEEAEESDSDPESSCYELWDEDDCEGKKDEL
jgi:hypothetical protein|tara:strand:+ start:125 stop:952 length:828 start_codon:yes stop_codon:yes gene_type:complete